MATTEMALGRFDDFKDGGCRVLDLGGFEVGIFRRGTKLIAWENRCPHYAGPVCQGKIFHRVEEMLSKEATSLGLRFAKDEHIVCPWHGYEFDLTTGRHPGDARLRLNPVAVEVRNGEVFAKVPAR